MLSPDPIGNRRDGADVAGDDDGDDVVVAALAAASRWSRRR
jgi:hypothetical protein